MPPDRRSTSSNSGSEPSDPSPTPGHSRTTRGGLGQQLRLTTTGMGTGRRSRRTSSRSMTSREERSGMSSERDPQSSGSGAGGGGGSGSGSGSRLEANEGAAHGRGASTLEMEIYEEDKAGQGDEEVTMDYEDEVIEGAWEGGGEGSLRGGDVATEGRVVEADTDADADAEDGRKVKRMKPRRPKTVRRMSEPVFGPSFPRTEDLFKSFDWEATPLGPPSTWSQTLRAAVSIIHNSEYPCSLFIHHTHLINIWNDRYATDILRAKHPTQYGRNGLEVWWEEKSALVGMFSQVFDERRGFFASGYRSFVDRVDSDKYMEESFFDFTHSPLVDAETDEVIAVFNLATDTTQHHLAKRRLELLTGLGAKASRAASVQGACHLLMAALKDNVDTPFAGIWTVEDEKRADKEIADDLTEKKRGKRPVFRYDESEVDNESSGTDGPPGSLGIPRTFRLTATTFDEGLVQVNYGEGEGDDVGSAKAEEIFQEGRSTRGIPEWLPYFSPSYNLNIRGFRPPSESGSSPAQVSTDASAAPHYARPNSPSTMSSSSGSDVRSPPTSWPLADLSTGSNPPPFLILSTPSPSHPRQESIVLPVYRNQVYGVKTVQAVLVVGLNPNRMLDMAYLEFFKSVTTQIDAALENGRNREEDRRASEALSRLNHQRIQFFQNTAHELRTPLTLMLGPLEELLKRYEGASVSSSTIPSSSLQFAPNTTEPESALTPKQADSHVVPPVPTMPSVPHTLSSLSLVSRNTRRLLKLVNTILRFSSIEAGRLETRFEKQKTFGLLTRQLCECFQGLSAQSGVDLIFEGGLAYEDGGRAATAATTGAIEKRTAFDAATEDALYEDIFIDAEQWEHIIFNLLSNAFKHTWKGSITCRLSKSIQDGREGARLDVQDTGVGIDAVHIKHVFDRFYRADNRGSRSAEGTGIGLSLVAEHVKLHGGKVSLVSKAGEGSTFSVWIPRGSGHLPRNRVFGLGESDEMNLVQMSKDHHSSSKRTSAPLTQAADIWNKTARELERGTWLEQAEFWMHDPSGEATVDAVLTAPPSPPVPHAERAASVPPDTFELTEDTRPRAASDHSGPKTQGIKRKISTDSRTDQNRPSKRDLSQSESAKAISAWSSMVPAQAVPDDSVAASDITEVPGPSGSRGGPAVPAHPKGTRATILLVEDNTDMRAWVSSLLQIDFDVLEAGNGQAALDLLRGTQPDLILSDIMMPVMDGIQLVREVRRDSRMANVPIVLLSARAGEDDSSHGLESGADDYIIKPFSPRDLLARCRVHIKLHRMRKRAAKSESDMARYEARSEAKNSLLALVSHELRTPLSSVVGALDLLKANFASSSGPAQLVNTISNGTATLHRMIEQLLDIAKIDSIGSRFSSETFDVDAMVTDAIQGVAEKAAIKGLDIFSITGSVPNTVNTDRKRLAQVLDILCDNAVKFTDHGEVVVRCWMEPEVAATSDVYVGPVLLCFAVLDSGCGIEDEDLGMIFEPFHIGDDSTTRRHGGAGLGLTLALNVVECAGGQIGVQSRPGQGSEFKFHWPVRLEAGRNFPSTSSTIPSAVQPAILVVSRKPTMSQSLRCTSAAFHWHFLDHVSTVSAALSIAKLYSQPNTLFIIVDGTLVEGEPASVDELLAEIRHGPVSTSIYCLVTNPIDRCDVPRQPNPFHGTISQPLHRSAVFAAVNRILQSSRPKFRNIASEPTAAAPSRPKLTKRPSAPQTRGKLLVAEDNAINAKILVQQLKRLGYDADAASDGRQVLELINKMESSLALGSPAPEGKENLSPPNPTPMSSYKAILMDLDMPICDGFQATAKVRELGGKFSELPIVAITANAALGDRERCLGAGMTDFVSKPVSINTLTELLRRNGL